VKTTPYNEDQTKYQALVYARLDNIMKKINEKYDVMDKKAVLVANKFVEIEETQEKDEGGNVTPAYSLWNDVNDEDLNTATGYAIDTASALTSALDGFYADRNDPYIENRYSAFKKLKKAYRDARRESNTNVTVEIIDELKRLLPPLGEVQLDATDLQKEMKDVKKAGHKEEQKKRRVVWR
jgi:hypothetical protein